MKKEASFSSNFIIEVTTEILVTLVLAEASRKSKRYNSLISKAILSFNSNAVKCLSHTIHSTANPWLVTVILIQKTLASRFKANATFHPEIKTLGMHWGEARDLC